MKLSVVGIGHVGLTTAACFARIGHDVIAVDADPARVEDIARGNIPFHEPGLAKLFAPSSHPAGSSSAPTWPMPRMRSSRSSVWYAAGKDGSPDVGALEEAGATRARAASDDLLLV
jgi:UDPglucose 6-dehydrogenase